MNITFEQLKGMVKTYENAPEELSKITVQLATLLYGHNEEMAQADLNEKRIMVGYLDSKTDEGKKYSVAESEVRAQVETENRYKLLKVEGEAIIEVINAIKARLNVLNLERKS